jgi:recombination protein RecA
MAVRKLSPAQSLANEINKVLGSDSIKMGNDPMFQTRYIATGVLPIDVILGGGLPRNRITEFYGGWSTLKSYVGLCAIAQCQAAGGVAALVDTEHSFDDEWGRELGVNIDDLMLPTIASAEEACDVSEVMIRNGIDLLVWDSVAATMPQDEAKKRMGKENIQPARQAAFMSAALRRINSVNKSTAIMFVNQTREKVGIMFGNPETTPGGKSLPFYASYRVAMRKGSNEKADVDTFDGKERTKVKRIVRQQVRATLEKSKLSAPGREFLFTWDHTTNKIDEAGFLMACGLENGWITQTGMNWTFNGRSVKGKENFKAWIESDASVKALMIDLAMGRSISPVGKSAVAKKTAAGQRKPLRLKRG